MPSPARASRVPALRLRLRKPDSRRPCVASRSCTWTMPVMEARLACGCGYACMTHPVSSGYSLAWPSDGTAVHCRAKVRPADRAGMPAMSKGMNPRLLCPAAVRHFSACAVARLRDKAPTHKPRETRQGSVSLFKNRHESLAKIIND